MYSVPVSAVVMSTFSLGLTVMMMILLMVARARMENMANGWSGCRDTLRGSIVHTSPLLPENIHRQDAVGPLIPRVKLSSNTEPPESARKAILFSSEYRRCTTAEPKSYIFHFNYKCHFGFCNLQMNWNYFFFSFLVHSQKKNERKKVVRIGVNQCLGFLSFEWKSLNQLRNISWFTNFVYLRHIS